MVISMRRSASTQAVSRKVEGIEPRNTRNQDDAFKSAEVNITTAANVFRTSADYLGSQQTAPPCHRASVGYRTVWQKTGRPEGGAPGDKEEHVKELSSFH